MATLTPILLNNVSSTVQAGSSAIGSASATGINVATGDGANFGTIGTNQYIPCVIVDTSTTPETVKEYVWVTTRSTDALTVVRQAEESSRFPASTSTIAAGYTIAAVATATTFGNRLIAATTLGSAAASISFSSIPAYYTHLRVVAMLRSTRSTVSDNLAVTVNGAAATLSYEHLSGSTSTVASTGSTSVAPPIGTIPGASAVADNYGYHIVDVPFYAFTDNHKGLFLMNGFTDETGSFFMVKQAFMRAAATTAVTSLTLAPGVGPNFAATSRAYLYGVV